MPFKWVSVGVLICTRRLLSPFLTTNSEHYSTVPNQSISKPKLWDICLTISWNANETNDFQLILLSTGKTSIRTGKVSSSRHKVKNVIFYRPVTTNKIPDFPLTFQKEGTLIYTGCTEHFSDSTNSMTFIYLVTCWNNRAKLFANTGCQSMAPKIVKAFTAIRKPPVAVALTTLATF